LATVTTSPTMHQRTSRKTVIIATAYDATANQSTGYK